LFSLHITWPDDRAALLALEKRIWLTGYGLGVACCFFGVAAVILLLTGGPWWGLPLLGIPAAIAGTASHVTWRIAHLAMDQLDATRQEVSQ